MKVGPVGFSGLENWCRGQKGLFFSEEILGNVSPGTFDLMAEGAAVKWGPNMRQPISPGVVKYPVEYFMVGETYAEPITSDIISDDIVIYVPAESRHRVRADRPNVWLWRYDRPFELGEFSDTDLYYEGSTRSKIFDFVGRPIYIIPRYPKIISTKTDEELESQSTIEFTQTEPEPSSLYATTVSYLGSGLSAVGSAAATTYQLYRYLFG